MRRESTGAAIAGPASPTRRRLLAGLAGAAILPRGAWAQGDHLAGAHLRIILASAVGSGTDAIGRAFARHAARLLPETEVTVENLSGAAGRLAEKATWEAGSDGLTLCFVRPSMKFRLLLEAETHPYGLGDFTWIGSLSRDRRVLVSRAGGELEDLDALLNLNRPATLAVDNVDSVRHRLGIVLNLLLGTRILPVPGYGGSDPFLALIGGEVDLLLGTFETSLSLLDGGEAKALLSLSSAALPAPYQAVPLLKDQAIPPEKRWLLELHRAEADLSRLVAAAPGLPPERSARLRLLFRQVMSDAAFREEMESLGLLLDPIYGEAVQHELREMASLMAGRVGDLQAALACGLERAEDGRSC